MNEVDFERKRSTVILKMFFICDFKSLPLRFSVKYNVDFSKKKITVLQVGICDNRQISRSKSQQFL